MDKSELNKYLGKSIKDICTVGYTDNRDNHCAHFVSHVLGFKFGFTCANMVHGEGEPASIRVHEVFKRCASVGKWADWPSRIQCGLVFITNAAGVNLDHKLMANVPRKHIGIFFGSKREIWHYSNSRNRVVTQTPEQFSRHYLAPYNSLFWGEIPSNKG